MYSATTKNILPVWLFLVLSLFWSCSSEPDSMTVEQRALFQTNRFDGDTEQDDIRKPLEVLRFLDVQAGDVVVDLFAGGGYFTELFNFMVTSKGKVFLQNHPAFVRSYAKELKKRLQNGRLKNTVRLDSTYVDLKLPVNVDIVFISLAYHDIYVKRKRLEDNAVPALFYKQVFDSLKPGGKLVVIDHSAMIGTKNLAASELHRIDEQWARQNFESAGFRFESELDVLRNINDERTLNIWDKNIFMKTDRFVHKYIKPIN